MGELEEDRGDEEKAEVQVCFRSWRLVRVCKHHFLHLYTLHLYTLLYTSLYLIEMAASLSSSVSSLQSSLQLLDSSITSLDSGVNDFPRLTKVLQTTRVRVPQPTLPNHPN